MFQMTAKGGKGLGGEVERSSLKEKMFFEEKLKSLIFLSLSKHKREDYTLSSKIMYQDSI